MGFSLGYSCKLYRNTGTYVSPTWVECTNVKDLTLKLDTDEADATTRGNAGFKARVPTLTDAGLDFDQVWDPSDAFFTSLLTAFLGKSGIELLALDGPVGTTGSQGLRATHMVKSFTREEKLADVVTAKVNVTPIYSTHAPSWFTAS